MQLHEAAAAYLEHRETLDNLNRGEHYDDLVWGVEYHKLREGYYLLLHHSLGDPCMDVDPDSWFEEYQEARHVTKQRGGTRIFKSLDAVAAALQQIGQPVLPLDRLPKPDGL